MDKNLFFNNLQKFSKQSTTGNFNSNIIKIAQDNSDFWRKRAVDLITNALQHLDINNGMLLAVLRELIFKYIEDIQYEKNTDNLNMEIIEAAIEKFKQEALPYQEQLVQLNVNYNRRVMPVQYLQFDIPKENTLQQFLSNIPDQFKGLTEETEQVSKNVVKIRARYFSDLEGKIRNLAKIAAKLNMPAPELEILAEENIVNSRGIADKWYTVRIIGIAPQINGWKIVAKIEHSPTGRNLVYTLPGQNVPQEYYEVGPNCEHCGYNRNRNNTYILQNIQNNTLKQVGSTCLKDFTGHPNPEVAASYFERLSALDPKSIEEKSQKDEYEGERSTYYFDPLQFLANVSTIIRKYGWVSRANAKNSYGGQTATIDRVLDNMFPGKYNEVITPSADDVELAQEALDWIRAQGPEFYDRNDYLNNLWVVSQNNHPVAYRHTALLASLLPTYTKTKIERQTRSTIPTQPEFVGIIGEKRTFRVLVEKMMPFPSNYGRGQTYLHLMRDENGNQIVWWAGDPLQEGETYTIQGKIKEHKVFNGIPQTIINYAKVIEE